MSSAVVSRERKACMFEKTREYFTKYENYMLLSIHKVQSTQFKDILGQLPSNFKVLFAKNKIMKKVLRELDPVKYKDMIDSIYGNVLIAFFDGMNPSDVLKVSEKFQRKAHAIAGDVTRKDIVVPSGPTGLPPEKINLFQAAKMNTKINKGKIDVVTEHTLVKAGEVVGISEANLLNMLNIMPFEFGMDIKKVCENGEFYSSSLLLIDETCIEASISESVSLIAAMSLGSGMVTKASLPYEISNAYRDIRKVILGLGLPMDN
ncbi:large subunit ribosomal protein LP0 [Pancytospora epiphaga]|nr:large subunit ribosomal protein LP0 [Pancytospora epiphaga]